MVHAKQQIKKNNHHERVKNIHHYGDRKKIVQDDT